MRQKYDIIMMIPGMPFQGDTLETKSLGGSETAGLYMARELVKAGHSVQVFNNCDVPGEYDGVHYRKLEQWDQFAVSTPHDVNIVQRVTTPFTRKIYSKLNFLWCHDLALGRQAEGS